MLKINFLKFRTLPPLSESSFLRYITFAAMYFAQGIPSGLLVYAVPAWLAIHGKSPGEIGGYIAVLGIPWSFKILNAPFMDRFTFLAMGRRRPWILIGQCGLVLSLVIMSFTSNPLDDLLLLMVMGFITNIFIVIQDIAVDSLAVDVLPPDQQARANGVMWGSKIIGRSLTVITASWLLNNYGFSQTMILFSLLTSITFIVPLMLRERPGEKLLPWTEGRVSVITAALQLHSFKLIFVRLFRAFFLPVSLLMGIAIFTSSIGEGLITSSLPIFTVQRIGWTNEDYSKVFAAANIISGLSGMIIGGLLTDLLGKIRMITLYLAGLIIVVGAFCWFSNLWVYEWVIYAFIISFYILLTFNNIALYASAMKLCSKNISATQFTLYMAIANLGITAGAAIIGPLKEITGWEYVLAAFIPIMLVTIILIRYIDFDRHEKRAAEIGETAYL